ncbi:hypothetical protein [Microbacterium panaciterrae]|uniref:Uncharacterized protein n=1 Tax=Microbacterium panaciterrae TaxID=985759 RepID=A0ABP8P6U4_9MICO
MSEITPRVASIEMTGEQITRLGYIEAGQYRDASPEEVSLILGEPLPADSPIFQLPDMSRLLKLSDASSMSLAGEVSSTETCQ